MVLGLGRLRLRKTPTQRLQKIRNQHTARTAAHAAATAQSRDQAIATSPRVTKLENRLTDAKHRISELSVRSADLVNRRVSARESRIPVLRGLRLAWINTAKWNTDRKLARNTRSERIETGRLAREKSSTGLRYDHTIDTRAHRVRQNLRTIADRLTRFQPGFEAHINAALAQNRARRASGTPAIADKTFTNLLTRVRAETAQAARDPTHRNTAALRLLEIDGGVENALRHLSAGRTREARAELVRVHAFSGTAP